MSEVRNGAFIGAAFAVMAGLAVAMPGIAAADDTDSGNATTSTTRRDHAPVRAAAASATRFSAARKTTGATATVSTSVLARPSAARTEVPVAKPVAAVATSTGGSLPDWSSNPVGEVLQAAAAQVPSRGRSAAVTPADPPPDCAERSSKNCAGENFYFTPYRGVDFTGVNLSKTTFHGDLSDANFTRAVLQDATLIGLLGRNSANVTGANFTDAKLVGIRDLRSVKGFTTATLTGADLYQQDLDGIQLAGKNLARTSLYDASLKKANLAGADLSGADLTLADLTGANLQSAVLTGADLNWADLTDANLKGIRNLKAVNGFTAATLTGADLSGQDLAGVQLPGEDLTKVNLTGANLSGANLKGADLAGATITGANLTDTNLTDAQIGNATWAVKDYKFVQLSYHGFVWFSPNVVALFKSRHNLGTYTMSDNPGLHPTFQGGSRPGKGGGLQFSINNGQHTAAFYQDAAGEHFRMYTEQKRKEEIDNRLVFTFTTVQSVTYNYSGNASAQNQLYLVTPAVDAGGGLINVAPPNPNWRTLSPGANQLPATGTLEPGTYTLWLQASNSRPTNVVFDLTPITG